MGKTQEEATLLDILIDGFEKNEVMDGYHWRDLPMPDEAAAARKFAALAEEAKRWKGTPLSFQDKPPRRLAAWRDLEIRQANRGVMVRARTPWFATWWHERETWHGKPMDAVYDWLQEERGPRG